MIRSIAVAALGYAAGTLPSADLVARAVDRAVDPNAQGSGNPGAVNVAQLLGNRAGAAVFGLDMGKAVAASRVGRALAGAPGANIAGAAAVLGHCFPVQRGFKGGKGVAASFGQMLATFPAYLPVDLALGAVAAKSEFWKQRPVGVIGATCGLWTGLAAVSSAKGLPNLWGPVPSPAMPLAAAVSSAAIVWRFADEARRAAAAADDASSVHDTASEAE